MQKKAVRYLSGARVPKWEWSYAGTVGTGESELCDVVALGADEAWAVGNQESYRRPLAVRWDGVRWQSHPVPGAGSLQQVAASAGDDVWAVSWNVGDDSLVHWDGRGWSDSPLAPVAGELDLHDVLSFAPDDAWVAGGASTVIPGGHGWVPVLQHWDGTRWSPATLPVLGSASGLLFGLGGRTADDVWAIGTTGLAALTEGRPGYLRFDGTDWRFVPQLDACRVLAESAVPLGRDVVFAGRRSGQAGWEPDGHPVLVRWNGEECHEIAAPPIDGIAIYDVTTDGAGGLWMTCQQQHGDASFWRWRAGVWELVAADPRLDRRSPRVQRLANVPGTADMWGVGHTMEARSAGLLVRYRETGSGQR
ncbi:hypothetical protein [Amycolatopsis sp. H20-H5]|uniref:hypothetical protein n=1 Tax=Amycolatopsis sp. H20-H5 TaxID=3046309 RepID=UPI002DBE095F|nr:hypothetical protein [Amycolatopsis sp. H20-H5]MEC3982591.1 hypothetical protein [Amycolatopsis sp. H20-H5]